MHSLVFMNLFCRFKDKHLCNNKSSGLKESINVMQEVRETHGDRKIRFHQRRQPSGGTSASAQPAL